ncbi:hypothetical protein [Nocardia sp. CNY236]|uniref:hypothetical protein n=1 Tax=Nocardia sp. CNY236 TaxID=1169152 RepID=UPI00041416AC|nr:hypothetical protein [Nocardia sp. CNY236]
MHIVDARRHGAQRTLPQHAPWASYFIERINSPMTDLPRHRQHRVFLDGLDEMRTTWQTGRDKAKTEVNELHAIVKTLTALKTRPRMSLPQSSEDHWYDPTVPSFPHDGLDTGDLFEQLIAYFQLMVYRYNEEVNRLTEALNTFDTSLTAALNEFRGSMSKNFTCDDVNTVLGRFRQRIGLWIVCVWDHHDEHGYGGSTSFYIKSLDGEALFDLAWEVQAWLTTPTGIRQIPCELADWVRGEATDLNPLRLGGDGDHNYAIQYHT